MQRDISSKHHCTLVQDTGLNYNSTTWCNGNRNFFSGQRFIVGKMLKNSGELVKVCIFWSLFCI